jgi:hypothetical protein
MLNRESQRLDLQEIGLLEQTIQINTQGKGGQRGQELGA